MTTRTTFWQQLGSISRGLMFLEGHLPFGPLEPGAERDAPRRPVGTATPALSRRAPAGLRPSASGRPGPASP